MHCGVLVAVVGDACATVVLVAGGGGVALGAEALGGPTDGEGCCEEHAATHAQPATMMTRNRIAVDMGVLSLACQGREPTKACPGNSADQNAYYDRGEGRLTRLTPDTTGPMTSMNAAARRAQRTAALLDLAQLGYAQWFFGNVYEAVVKIPDRLSARTSDFGRESDVPPRSVLGPGSPVRYYLPAVPISAVGTLGAVLSGQGNPRSRRWLTVSAGCCISGTAITAYVVRNINIKLFFAAQPPPPQERDALLCTWYRLNVMRAAAAGGAVFAISRARLATLRNTTE